jgi:hypothetical protein
MMKYIHKLILICSLLSVSILPLLSVGQIAYADDLLNGAQNQACAGVGLGDPTACGTAASNGAKINTLLTNVVNLLSIIIGIAAVIVLMIQGFRFIVSGGDPASINGARNGILYACVGLVVAIAAQLIVHLVIAKGTGSN